MSERTVVVPVRYPLEAASVRTLRRAIETAEDHERAHLYVLHVNLLHSGRHVSRRDLARAVEREVGPLENASYHVRDAFLLEEAILYEAVQQNADYVVVGRDRKASWRRILSERLGLRVDVEAFLAAHLDAKLVVVGAPRRH